MGKIGMKIILTILLYLVSPLIFLFVLVVAIVRWIASKIVVLTNPKVTKVLTARSSVTGVHSAYKPNPLNMIISFFIFEGTLDVDQFIQDAQLRIVYAQDARKKLFRPEMQQYIIRRWGFLFWKNEPNFEISQHIRMFEGKFNNQAEFVSPEMMLEVGKDILRSPFPPEMSPWEFIIFHNYKDTPESPVGTAVVLKIHHALADGTSIFGMMRDLMLRPLTKDELGLPATYSNRWYHKLATTVAIVTLGPYQFISAILDCADPPPTLKVGTKAYSNHFNSAVSPMIPLEKFEEICKFHAVSRSAVIFSAYTGALKRFLSEAGYVIPNNIHCSFPLAMPGHPGRKMGNHWTGALVELPLRTDNRIERLQYIQRNLKDIRNSTFLLFHFGILGLVGILFGSLIKPLMEHTGASVICSNLRVPDELLSYNGHNNVSAYFTANLGMGICAIGFSAVTCARNIRFVFAMDEAVVPRDVLLSTQLATYFIEELDFLKFESAV